MSLGTKLAEQRKQNGLSQESLANSVGVSTAYISQIENGLKNPSYSLLLKLSHTLNVPVEHFVGGEIEKSEDPLSRTIMSIIKHLDTDKKKAILDYIYFLTKSNKFYDFPLFEKPSEYAQYILNYLNYSNPPIDPFDVAAKLGVKIIISSEPLEHEGILYQSGSQPLIVLSADVDYKARRKFTVAMLLGHLIIPWHTDDTYFRKKDKRSLDEENTFSIEARQFAGALLIPSSMLKKDFQDLKPGIQSFEELAYEKYHSSMLAIGHIYVDSHGKSSIMITSNKTDFTRVYEMGFPYFLVDSVPEKSVAYSFITNPPSIKEIRSEIVSADVWFKNAPKGLKLYEESLLDPSQGITVTFLQTK